MMMRIVAAWLLTAGAAFAQCAPDRVDVRGEFGTVRFRAELATTPQDQAQGLMFRKSLPRLGSMLFIYPEAQNVSFWMRNTEIPLDIIFIDAEGRITRVHENAVPFDETPIPAGAPTLAVLEINGGLAADLGIDAGDEVRNPALPQEDAAWSCLSDSDE
ncbi:hypothetical protein JSE7799_03786 [Jannaschia seosinensis]|uniref:ACR n=1 Tax=Jannaschia seosinensis TaxID=313367 RepID=A0A0M7BGL7_9RHOB|nr:DUF192 domain-containing protein [Jannaschia seosinensis]CUH41043.1 hypothetical protein JSE7799_03786 [Jannaschia seosinensis]